jgi:hypothetical protein
MPVESLQKRGVGPRELVRLAEVFASAFKRLLADHGAAITFHRGIVACNELCCHHAFQLIVRINANEPCYRGADLIFSLFFI